MTTKCPDCHSEINYRPPIQLNQLFTCSNCGLELEVIWLYPLEFAKISPANANPEKKRGKRGFKKKIQG